MQTLLNKLAHALQCINECCGRSVAWLTLLMVCTTFLIVIQRYLFKTGSIALQESVTYMHAMIFMLGTAYAMKHGEHVRVDIFYNRYSPKGKALIDFLGGLLFLLPFCIFILIISWDYVQTSWMLKEGSREAGGLPFVYLLKILIPCMCILLIIQGIASLIKNGLILTGYMNNQQEPC